MTEFTSAYALARHVAHQLPQHSGKSARELYQAFLPEFSAFGTDGSTGATMINQHLRRMEEGGLVISEKGKLRGNPSKWFWTGPSDASAEPEKIEPMQPREPFRSSEPRSMREPSNPSEPISEREPPQAREPPTSREQYSGSEPKTMREPSHPSEPKNTMEPSQPSDPNEDQWDLLAHQFAAACREQAATDISIDDVDNKLLVIYRLKPIVSADIADVLDAIGDDLVKIRGVTP